MSGRKSRQWRESAARLATARPCDCGCYPHDFITPCGFLAWCSETRRAGFCSQCGYRLIRRIGWDGQMGAIVRYERCPTGCSSSHTWTDPAAATQAERDALGLVLKQPPSTNAVDPDGGTGD